MKDFVFTVIGCILGLFFLVFSFFMQGAMIVLPVVFFFYVIGLLN